LTQAGAALLASTAALISLIGCAANRPQERPPHDAPMTSPAAVAGDARSAPTLSEQHTDDPIAELVDSAPSPRERTAPPPRLHGRTFNTAVVDELGRTRRIEIRMRDGVAETRVDGSLVAPDRVLVHRRGFVEIVDERGARDLHFNLPRGMTSVTQAGR